MNDFNHLGPNEKLIGLRNSRLELSTPSLVLDLDCLEENIAHMSSFMNKYSCNLRPVAKIHKSVEIAKRQIDAGAIGVCCASLAEAEVMVQGGVPGVLLFTSVVTNEKINRLCKLNSYADGLLVAVDNKMNIDQLAYAVRNSGSEILRLLVDVEVGGRRTGVTSEDVAIDLAKHIESTDGVEFLGLQGYFGGLQRIPIYDERASLQKKCTAPLINISKKLEKINLTPEIITGGGTGTYAIDSLGNVFTENQAGTYVFLDVNYMNTNFQNAHHHPFKVALFVRTTVISDSNPEYLVTDAGIKEFGREFLAPQIISGSLRGAKYDLIGDDLGRVETVGMKNRPSLGDSFECVTPHCYATLNLYSVYHCVRGNELVDIWKIDAREQC